jgi:hypothetical protein
MVRGCESWCGGLCEGSTVHPSHRRTIPGTNSRILAPSNSRTIAH